MKSLGQDNLFVDCEDSIDMKIGNVTNAKKIKKINNLILSIQPYRIKNLEMY